MDATSTPAASALAGLFPGYFALVMATGIVAIGSELDEWHAMAWALFVVAAIAYVLLAVLLALRIVLYRDRFVDDVTNHARGFAFLTTVAATEVVGSASAVVVGWWGLAWVLWWIGVVLWVVFVYITLISVVIKAGKPGLQTGINGSWFLLTVATESVAVLAGLHLARTDNDLLAFFAVSMFGLGVVLYLIVMTMVFLRWTFQELDPTEADPPAWIAAGAVAITVLAGSNLLLAAPTSERLTRLVPFIEGVVVAAWATSTFWFPLMIAIGVWRHVVRRMPLRYHPSYWAMVFPLGMYGVATFRMRAAIGLDALAWLSKVTLFVALAAWTVTSAGLAEQLRGSVAGRASGSRTSRRSAGGRSS